MLFMDTKGRVLWGLLVAGGLTLQVMFGRWAFLAYRREQIHCAPGYPNCLGLRLYHPPVDAPAGGYIAVWVAVDLALVLLGLWLVARQDAWEGAAWRKGALRQRAVLAAAALAIQVVFGYWWAMAYALGPHGSGGGECPACFRRALREQNVFEAVDPARHRSTGGTGLGLSIVKHVAAWHGARSGSSPSRARGRRLRCGFPVIRRMPAPD